MQLRFAEPERMLSGYISKLCMIHCELFSRGRYVCLWGLILAGVRSRSKGVLSLNNLGVFRC